MNHLVGLESRKIKSVRYRVRDGKKREGKRASRRSRRRLNSSLSFSLVLPCAAILFASAISSSVRGFALGTGLTAEAGSQAMEEIIGGNYSKQKVEECGQRRRRRGKKKRKFARPHRDLVESKFFFPPSLFHNEKARWKSRRRSSSLLLLPMLFSTRSTAKRSRSRKREN